MFSFILTFREILPTGALAVFSNYFVVSKFLFAGDGDFGLSLVEFICTLILGEIRKWTTGDCCPDLVRTSFENEFSLISLLFEKDLKHGSICKRGYGSISC